MAHISRAFEFQVISTGGFITGNPTYRAYLVRDNWDDYHFKTLFYLIVYDRKGIRHDIGGVKIGRADLHSGGAVELPGSFSGLGEEYFSLGQDDSYYQNLIELERTLQGVILAALRDIAADLPLFGKVAELPVTQKSLLRSVTESTVRGQFHRLTKGGARLQRFSFAYSVLVSPDAAQVDLGFDVRPESKPPSNIHILIGRNGVGKTYLLNDMAKTLVGLPSEAGSGRFTWQKANASQAQFARLVSVSFSAFDGFPPLPERDRGSGGPAYRYIGLKCSGAAEDAITNKASTVLEEEFAESVEICLEGAREARWRDALRTLESDPMFRDFGISDISDSSEAKTLFSRLSSGHKIVLLTMTRLVELVEERTLILMDEPESHLHPPLLSAFVRSLSNLLLDRNGVAILATHSPVVLQEVPRHCTWVLQRMGSQLMASRPSIETFGENVGVLTQEVFGLEVTDSGFHRLLSDEIERNPDFDGVVSSFGNQLGDEARAIVRALIASRSSTPED